VHLVADRDQFEELLVAEPVEQEDGAQIVDTQICRLPHPARLP
jgi:hypothetical protein